ncbi:MAG: PAS domain S-box protein [archaeon]
MAKKGKLSKRKESVDKLKESEEKYKNLFDNLINGFALHEIITNKQGKPIDYRFIEVNHKFQEMTGLKRNKILRKTVREILPDIEKDSFDWIGKYGEVALKGKELKFEHFYPAPLNKWFAVSAFSPRKNFFAVMIDDISKKKKAEEELKLFSQIVEQSAEGIAVADLNGNIILVNSAWCKMHGYKKIDDCMGKNLSIFHNKEQLKNEVIPFNKKLKKVGSCKGEVGHVTKEGKTFTTSMTSTLLKDSQGKPFAIVGIAKDITERKQFEESLQENENRLRIVGKILYDLIYEWDVKTDDLHWFGDIDGLLGFKKGEISQNIEEWLKLIHPEDLKQMKDAVKLHKTSKKPINYNYRIRTKEGLIRYWEDRALPVFDKKGLPIKWIGICADITNKKQTEQSLKENEERFRNIVNHSKEVFYIHDTNHKITYISNQCKEMFGYTPEEMRFKWTETTTNNVVNDAGFELTMNALKTGVEQEPYLLELKRKDGSIFWVEVDESPMKDKNGKVIGMVGALRDVTEQKKLTDALTEEKRFSDTLIDTAPGFIMILDTGGYIMLFNKTAEKISEYKKSEVLNKNWFDIFLRKEDENKVRKIHNLTQKEKSSSFENYIITKSGKNKLISWTNSVIENDAGQIIGVMAIGLDVTDKRKVEQDILKRTEDLEKFHSFAVGRELAMVKLKDKIQELEEKLKQQK